MKKNVFSCFYCKCWYSLLVGENLNSKDQEDVKMTCNEANSDLHLAWNMLDIARGIVAKSPEKTMEKVNIFYALAEVWMKRGSSVLLVTSMLHRWMTTHGLTFDLTSAEDRDSAIGYYLEGLAILEHLVKPVHIGVVQLYPLCGDNSVNHSAIRKQHVGVWFQITWVDPNGALTCLKQIMISRENAR